MPTDWALLVVAIVVLVIAISLAITTVRATRRVEELERLVYRLAEQSEDQASLINEHAQFILRIAGELRRSR